MTNLRAFVGHSFSEVDETVVDVFLKFFRTLQNGIMSFDWDHALAAESRDLATKVLEKIDGKNIFIGICTRKEKILKRGPRWHFLGFAYGRYEFEWKTSDWVIQEIGLAIGRGMRLILLVEDGVRIPGGLQGNVNFIPFKRDQPQQCFAQILEMLNSIAPNPANQSNPMIEIGKEPTSNEEPNQRKDPEWTIPKPGWDQKDFEMALLWAFLRGDEAKKQELQKLFEGSKLASDEKSLAAWKAVVEYRTISHGEGGRLNSIKKLAEDNAKNSEVLTYLAHAYSHFENHLDAARTYEAAGQHATTPESIAINLTSAARCYVKADRLVLVEPIADRIREAASEAKDELIGLRALSSIYEDMKRPVWALALRERIAELEPDDFTDRFNLAYGHSDGGDEDLALFHYRKIPDRNRTATAFNNLGVAYNRFKIKARAVEAFKKAKAMGDTLAMSNLAYSYAGAGFLSEARAECDTAVGIDGYHNNINLALARIHEIDEEEEKRTQEVLSRAVRKGDYLRRFGRAVAGTLPKDVPLHCRHPTYGLLEFKIVERSFTALGTYKRTGELSNALMGVSSPILTGNRTVVVTLSGTLLGRAVEALLTRDDGRPRGVGLLGALEDSEMILMYYDEDERVWKILERPFSNDPRFMTLTNTGTR